MMDKRICPECGKVLPDDNEIGYCDEICQRNWEEYMDDLLADYND